MPFSHHSHSGQFCNHATDELEDVVQEAIRQKFHVLALTEHMPRDQEEDLYPGEAEIGWDLPGQAQKFAEFHTLARRLQMQYADRINLLVGMEVDWIRASSKDWIEHLLRKYPLDLFVGSVHHVHGPIDFSAEKYADALASAAANIQDPVLPAELRLFMDYFDAQFEMLNALRPPVVGHFDLIRLLSSDPDGNMQSHPQLWAKIVRNLEVISAYGGVLELNSSGLRKGLKEPYPAKEICKTFLAFGGKFCFSDDSHGIKMVGHSYGRLLEYATELNIKSITIFRKGPRSRDPRFPHIETQDLPVEEVRKLGFWTQPP